jgi:hypothetical protein
VWAVGGGSTDALIEHWDGKAWSVVRSPHVGDSSTLYGAVALRPDSAWAVGSVYAGDGTWATLTEHWNGRTWSLVPSKPAGRTSTLTGVSAIPGTHDLWAVGYSESKGGDSSTLIELCS